MSEIIKYNPVAEVVRLPPNIRVTPCCIFCLHKRSEWIDTLSGNRVIECYEFNNMVLEMPMICDSYSEDEVYMRESRELIARDTDNYITGSLKP